MSKRHWRGMVNRYVIAKVVQQILLMGARATLKVLLAIVEEMYADFIDKYGNGRDVSMKEVENRLKTNFDDEKPSDLFENWTGLVFLSFPLCFLDPNYR